MITDYYIFSAAEENFFEVCLQSSPSSINISLLLTLCHESSTDENTHPPCCQWQISALALLGLCAVLVFAGLRVQWLKNNEECEENSFCQKEGIVQVLNARCCLRKSTEGIQPAVLQLFERCHL